jgi:hypothetical protein
VIVVVTIPLLLIVRPPRRRRAPAPIAVEPRRLPAGQTG